MGTMGKISSNTLPDRIGNLLLSSQWSDCFFKVESTVIAAHRLILAASSPVFEVMLYGPMAESKQINVCDIEAVIFHKMLNYIYTDKATIADLEDACRLLYAATKYMLFNLQQHCWKYITSEMSVGNVLMIFDFAESIQDVELQERCLDLICKHTVTVFSENNFHINAFTLRKIANQDKINISEMELLAVCNRWAEKECDLLKIKSVNESKRSVLIKANVLNKIRFLSFSRSDFINCKLKFDILTNDEIQTIQNCLVCDSNFVENVNLCCNNKPREPIQLRWLFCAPAYFKAAEPLWVDYEANYVKMIISSNRTVLVNSFNIHSRMPPTEQRPFLHKTRTYNEKIRLQINDSLGNVIAKTYFDNIVEYYSTVSIDLPAPVVFLSAESYAVVFEWNFNENYSISVQYPQHYVSNIGTTGTKHGVIFSLKNHDKSFLGGITFMI